MQKETEAILTTGKEIYPHRRDLYNLNFYKCKTCGNYVGCHKGTLNSLGVIPTKELKQARIKVHSLLDPLWKSKKYSRSYIYKKLSNHLGYQYHTANTKSIEECERIAKLLINFEGVEK